MDPTVRQLAATPVEAVRQVVLLGAMDVQEPVKVDAHPVMEVAQGIAEAVLDADLVAHLVAKVVQAVVEVAA